MKTILLQMEIRIQVGRRKGERDGKAGFIINLLMKTRYARNAFLLTFFGNNLRNRVKILFSNWILKREYFPI